MKIARNNQELEAILSNYKTSNPNYTIGFVPTMGALHEGHMSLVNYAKTKVDIVVASVFVNPTQFNLSSDLDLYPRTEQADIHLLDENNCDVIYLPTVIDIYPNKELNYFIELDGLDKVLEGKYRDDHFDGVCMVVERFFDLVKPNYAFFGKKDFQQVAVVSHMVKKRKLNVQIVSCSIKREEFGLAMSSRNMLLTSYQLDEAKIIYKALSAGVSAFRNGFKIDRVRETMLSIFNRGSLKLEYLEIVDDVTLKEVDVLTTNCTVCIAAYCGSVRLIDNFQFSMTC